MNYEFFVSESLLPKHFRYPKSYIEFAHASQMPDFKMPNLGPWHFFYNYLDFHFNGLKERYPKRMLVPFARRSDTDDVSCFDAGEISDDPKVRQIHDWASPGWEYRGWCMNFLEWLEMVDPANGHYVEIRYE